MLKNDLPEAYSFRYDNLNFTALPSSFFDILWGHDDCYLRPGAEVEIGNLRMKTFSNFFEEINDEISIDNFFSGCFAFHWHNRWDAPELKNSYAGKLNSDLDRIIKEKYNINPMKIFTT